MVFRSRRARRFVACAAVLALGFPYAASAHGATRIVVAQATPAAAVPATAPPTTPPPVPPAPARAPQAAPLPGPPANAPTVVSIDVSGNAHVPTSTILAVVRSRVGQPFDERLVREDLQSIDDLGYFGEPPVPPLIRQRPGGIAITFRVIENPVITRIEFTGNDHVPSDTLLALMDTSVGQVFNNNTFHQDVLKVNSYYDKIGYSGQLPTHVSGVNVTKDGTLSVAVREGLTISDVTIGGDPLLSKALILQAISLKKGQPYSDDARDKDYETLKKLYEKYDVQLGDFEAGIDPTTVDLTKGTANVKYTLYAAKVGAVEITGNTRTKDIVIRRQLRLRPGMYVTQGLLKTDDQRLQNLGFFDKVDLNAKPGPDPKKPWEVTLDWNVKEQRTGTAQVGAGYSGGPTGQGLTGTLSYSQNNIGGNGNSGSVRVERGARISDASLSYSVPYLGNTPKLEKYSLAATLFTSAQSNFYQVYSASPAGSLGTVNVVSTPAPSGSTNTGPVGTIPVVLTPNGNALPVAALYGQRSTGVGFNLGRRLNDTLTATLGISVQRVGTDVTLPSPYYLSGTQTILNQSLLSTSPFGTATNGTTLGIIAPSIADTSNGAGYNLHSVTLGLQKDNRDDVYNPRRGTLSTLTEELSGQAIGSQFHFTKTTLDAAKFFPVLSNSTLALHVLAGDTTGAIPPSELYVLTDQQLRGYSQVFYGTQEVLAQGELRFPLSPDRKFNLAAFGDYGAQKIRGAQPITDAFNNVVVDYSKFLYRADVGLGLRFDVPQLGFRSIRLDFAKGKSGTHTSFGIGQSF